MITLSQYQNYTPSSYVSGRPELEIKINDTNRMLLPKRFQSAVEIFISGYEITWKLNRTTNDYEFCFVSPTSRGFTGVIYDVEAGDWERQDVRDEYDLINAFKRMMADKEFANMIFNSFEWQDEA